jgi:hypothetical protein
MVWWLLLSRESRSLVSIEVAASVQDPDGTSAQLIDEAVGIARLLRLKADLVHAESAEVIAVLEGCAPLAPVGTLPERF